MKTPMQEMLEWVRATLPMDLDWPMLIEEKVKSLIPKEKEVMFEFAKCCTSNGSMHEIDYVFNEIFNTKEK